MPGACPSSESEGGGVNQRKLFADPSSGPLAGSVAVEGLAESVVAALGRFLSRWVERLSGRAPLSAVGGVIAGMMWSAVAMAQVGVVDPDAAYSALLVVTTSGKGERVTYRARVYREPGRLRFEDLDRPLSYVFRYDRRQLWILRDPLAGESPAREQRPLKDGLGIAPFIDEFLFAEDPFTGRLSRAFGMESPQVIALGQESVAGRLLFQYKVQTPHWQKGKFNIRHIWVDPQGVVVRSRLDTPDGTRSSLELRDLRVGVQAEGVFDPRWQTDLRGDAS